MKVVHWNELDDNNFILDVRTKKEFDRHNIPRAKNIPVDELRNNLELLPEDIWLVYLLRTSSYVRLKM